MPTSVTPQQLSLIGYKPYLQYVNRNRSYKDENEFSVIGLKSPEFIVSVADGRTEYTVIEDFTTYADKAILKITHNDPLAADIVILGGCIRGAQVTQIGGKSGYRWEYTDYASIERNGEKSIKIENDYLTSAAQCKAVGDYEWKESRYHPQYSVTLNGLHYKYAIGDRWTLVISHVVNGQTLENINSEVIITGVKHSRRVGDIGSTMLELRVPSDAWSATIAKNAKLTGAGKANWKGNRSNIVTVAASTYVGQADYYCDGTADDVEIQAAIDALNNQGGGRIDLTEGVFNTTAAIVIESNIIINGTGNNTIIDSPNTIDTFSITSENKVVIQNLKILGDGTVESEKAAVHTFGTTYDVSVINTYIYATSFGVYTATTTININTINCVIEECGSSGIYYASAYGKVLSCEIRNNNGDGVAIDATGVKNLITGNRIYGNGSNYLDNGTGTIATGNSIG